MKRVLLAGLVIAAGVAQAQVGLPPVRLPSLPQLPLSGVGQTLGSAGAELDVNALQEARGLRVRELIRRNRASIEADPRGAAIVRGELTVVSASDADLNAALAAGFTVARTIALEGLDTRLIVLRVPPDTTTRRALERLRALAPNVTVDFNHIYLDSGDAVAEATPASASVSAADAIRSAASTKIGLVDSGVDVAHPVFAGLSIERHGCNGSSVPAAHGTAVASLLIGRAGDFHGAAPGATLYAADVYCGAPTGGAVDAVADALAWLVRERVPVINISLVGPSNATLAAVVRLVVARGYLLVAAVGNDGPAAPPLYPASYPGVVGVTAVDAHRHALIEAARGPQVKFAAPGADMCAAKAPQSYELVRGTSFAAPIVAALLSALLPAPGTDAAARALEQLTDRAIGLGSPHPNPIYGYGLVGADLAPAPRLASAGAR